MNTPAGHEEQFVKLLTRHQGALHGFLITLMGCVADYEDVLQNVNEVLWKKREEFEPGTNFKAWMFTTARFQVMAWRKTKVRRAWLRFSDELIDVIEAETSDRCDDEALFALRRCLSKLNDAERDLVMRRYEAGFSIKAYAERHDQEPTRLRTLLFRVRAALRSCIQTQLAGESAT